jgi:hypothetical protein
MGGLFSKGETDMGVLRLEKQKAKEFVVNVVYVNQDGIEIPRDLTFTANYRDWAFLQRLKALSGNAEATGLDAIENIKNLWEVLMPGQWAAWLEFVEGDGAYMGMIGLEASRVVKEYGISERMAEIKPGA